MEERKERMHRRLERRERQKEDDGVVEGDQPFLGNWKHNSDWS